ncbi:MAG: acyl-CoA dehydrogenase family protein [Myxococcales bacterium]|nr:acyl-CoA dehydrogenase family protein [Myxococcales bacterium]HIK83668.1 acyl-CoA dehydrogenase family protein [Myxococcales bacterium]
MGLIRSGDQLILRDMSKSFWDKQDAVRFSRDLWKEMGELGWIGILFPESLGGTEIGYGELGIVLAECRPRVGAGAVPFDGAARRKRHLAR